MILYYKQQNSLYWHFFCNFVIHNKDIDILNICISEQMSQNKFKIFLRFFFSVTVLSVPSNIYGQSKLDSLIRIVDTIKNIDEQVDFLYKEAFKYIEVNINVSISLTKKAEKIAENSNNVVNQGKCLNILGIIAQTSGNFNEAAKHYYNAIKIWELEKDTGWLAATHNNLGIVYYYSGNYQKALEQYIISANHSVSLNDSSTLSSAYNNIGIVLSMQKNYDKAYEYYLKSLDIALKENSQNGIATAYNNMGEIFNSKEEFDSALYYYGKSLKLNIETGSISSIANTYLNFGDVAHKQKKFDLAFKNFNKAEKYYYQVGDSFSIIDLEILRAQTRYQQKKYALALKHVNNVYSKIKEIGSLDYLIKIHRLKSEILEKQGNYKNALIEFKQFKINVDSIAQQDVQNKLNNYELLNQFEFEKNKIEIENINTQNETELIIAKQNRNKNYLLIIFAALLVITVFIYRLGVIRKNANAELLIKNQQVNEQSEELKQTLHQLSIREQQLLDTNKTKDRMFSIIGHDLRGPVGSLQKLLELLTEQFESFELKEIKEMLITANDSSQQTFNLLENLLLWARAQKNEMIFKPHHKKILSLVEENIKLLKGTADIKSIKIINKVSKNCSAYCDSNSVSTILRNLISNAIKFTPENGTVQIACIPIDNYINISIKDTGVGIKPEMQDKLFDANNIYTTYGTNNEKGTGLGLKLCNDLAILNDSTIYVESEIGKGSTFFVSLPIKPSKDEQQ